MEVIKPGRQKLKSFNTKDLLNGSKESYIYMMAGLVGMKVVEMDDMW